jgi:hypothetical protein
MAKAPEDMTFEDLEAVCAGYCCRALTVPFVSGALPLGSWSHVNFPMADIEEHDGNPAVHYIHVITRHSMEISFGDLALQYKNAIMHKDLDLLRRPFGPKVAVPKDTKLQFIVLTPLMARSLSSSITFSHRNASHHLSRISALGACTGQTS